MVMVAAIRYSNVIFLLIVDSTTDRLMQSVFLATAIVLYKFSYIVYIYIYFDNIV